MIAYASMEDRTLNADVSSQNRSRLTNGRLWPAGVDGRSAEARRFRDLYHRFANETPQNSTQTSIDARLRALVGVTMAVERIGAQQARGEPADTEELTRLVNAQVRLMAELGLGAPAEEPELTTEQLYARARGELET